MLGYLALSGFVLTRYVISHGFSQSSEKGGWQCPKHVHIKGIETRKEGWATLCPLKPDHKSFINP